MILRRSGLRFVAELKLLVLYLELSRFILFKFPRVASDVDLLKN